MQWKKKKPLTGCSWFGEFSGKLLCAFVFWSESVCVTLDCYEVKDRVCRRQMAGNNGRSSEVFFFHSKTPLAKGDTPVKEPAHKRSSCRNCKQKLREHKQESWQRRHTADSWCVFHLNPEIVQKGSRRQKICLMETCQFKKKSF